MGAYVEKRQQAEAAVAEIINYKKVMKFRYFYILVVSDLLCF